VAIFETSLRQNYKLYCKGKFHGVVDVARYPDYTAIRNNMDTLSNDNAQVG
jgi:hypothetical protein